MRLSLSETCDLFTCGGEEHGSLGGAWIDWEGLFRCFGDGRGGTGNLFFNGGSVEMGGDGSGFSWVEIAFINLGGDSLRLREGRHCALDVWASTMVAARSGCGSGLRVSDQTGTWLLLWGSRKGGPREICHAPVDNQAIVSRWIRSKGEEGIHFVQN